MNTEADNTLQIDDQAREKISRVLEVNTDVMTQMIIEFNSLRQAVVDGIEASSLNVDPDDNAGFPDSATANTEETAAHEDDSDAPDGVATAPELADSLNKQIGDLQTQLEEALEVSFAVADENTLLCSTNTDLTTSNTDLADSNAELTTANTELQAANTELTEANTELADENSQLSDANAALTEANAGLTGQSSQQTNTEAELTRANRELTDAKDKLADANDELTGANTQLTTDNGELTAANCELTATNGELTATNTELAAANTELTAANGELADANGELTDANTQLATSNAELKDSNTELTGANTELTDANAELTTANTELTGVNAELTVTNAELTAALEDLRVQASDLAQLNESFSADAPLDSQQLDELREENAALIKQNEELASRIAAATVEKTVASSSGESLTWEDRKALIMDQLSDDSFDADAFIENLGEQTAADGEIDPIEYVQEMEAELQRRQDELDRRDEEIKELRILLQNQAETRDDGVVYGAAAIAEMVDSDELVRDEQDRLQQMQAEWEEKFRACEIAASLERAKLSRERQAMARTNSELEDQLADLKRELKSPTDPTKPPQRRWLAKLGLDDKDGE